MVPRFASKEDSRRRAVPVYCASNEESEMVRALTVYKYSCFLYLDYNHYVVTTKRAITPTFHHQIR